MLDRRDRWEFCIPGGKRDPGKGKAFSARLWKEEHKTTVRSWGSKIQWPPLLGDSQGGRWMLADKFIKLSEHFLSLEQRWREGEGEGQQCQVRDHPGLACCNLHRYGKHGEGFKMEEAGVSQSQVLGITQLQF